MRRASASESAQGTDSRSRCATLAGSPCDRYEALCRNLARRHHGKGSVNFITARGCPYKCRWCSHQVYGQTHRRRNPLKVVDEVEWLLTEYTPDMVWVSDDVFTINHALAARICGRDAPTRHSSSLRMHLTRRPAQ